MARIKGAAIREFLAWVRRDQGADELTAKLARAEGAELLDMHHTHLGLLPSAWYEAEHVHAWMDAAGEGLTPPEVERMVDLGTDSAMKNTLTRWHRALIRVVGSPSLHARFAQKLWDTYYDEGTVQSEQAGPTRQIISYHGWTAHHPLVCATTTASDRTIFGAMGLSGVRVEPLRCVDRGDAECAHAVEWRG